MRRVVAMALIGIAALVLAYGAAGQPAPSPAAPAPADAVRFAAYDVIVDPAGRALAAYQLEFRAEPGTSTVAIVGIEGGEHAAFARAPYYDPAAMQQDRAVLAAFHTGDDLPAGPTRVARVHVRITGERPPVLTVTPTTAATRGGDPIAISVRIEGANP